MVPRIASEYQKMCLTLSRDPATIEHTEPKTERDEMTPDPKLPMYACHKKVEALKIHSIDKSDADRVIISPDDGCPGHPVVVSTAYMAKHSPQPGGYYVRYADGYESYSPAKAFEEGYTLLDGKCIGSGSNPALGGETDR